MEINIKKQNVPIRTDNDIVESPSVTALMRYLLSQETGKAQNPDYLGDIFVNGKWTHYLKDPESARELFNKKLPGILYYHLIRTKHFDKSFLKWANTMPNSQIVILGAGYDSRAIRFEQELKKNAIKVYEVDLKALLDYKKNIIDERLNITLDNLTYVYCNFQKDNIIEQLSKSGFDLAKPTFILWEGVTFFLTEQNVRYYLKLFKDNITDLLQIIFDYDMRDFVEGNLEYYGGKELYTLTTDDLGEPHLFGLNYDEVENFAEQNGYKVKSNYTSFMLEALYLKDNFGNSVGTPHGFNATAEIMREPKKHGQI